MIDLKNLKQPFMGQTCRELRERSGLTVAEFSKYAGVTRQAVYKFERGKSASIGLLLKYYNLGGVENET